METHERTREKGIVRAASQSLTVRSAAIVTRGLRDLARDSNWLTKKVFSGRATSVSISPAGQVCAVSPTAHHSSEKAVVYEMELNLPSFTLAVPGEPASGPAGSAAAFGWSASARYLIATLGAWRRELHVFDLQAKAFLGTFEAFSNFPKCLAWSGTGRYFAAAASGGAEARLRLWKTAAEPLGRMPFPGQPATEIVLAGLSNQSGGAEMIAGEVDDEGAAAGFGRVVFSPDEGTLASVVEMEGEWADDSIELLEMPALRRRHALHAQGHITDLSWTFDSLQLVYCSAGQAFQLAAETMEPEALPFGAELCACHPYLPLCVCFSSWLKNSPTGRLFVVDLKSKKVFDERPAEGIVDLRWSVDGLKAYAVTADGLAYIYEPTLL